MPSALQAGRPVRRVGMSPLSRPREPTLRPSIDPVPLQRGTPQGMLPHVAPRRTKCTVFGYAAAGAIERLPDHHPQQQRGEGHSRSCSKTRITASQSIRMLLHVVPGQPVCLDSPSPHKLPPGETPAYRPPKGNGAVRSRMQSSQVPVAPACHCAVLV